MGEISSDSPRDDAIAIWHAGVAAVRSETLIQAAVQREPDALILCGERLPLSQIDRIAVVGAGKAGGGMAAGFEAALGDDLLDRVTGWVNVPADCVVPLQRIHLHPARPASVNEPTEAGVLGARRMLDLVASLGPHDLCVVLLSGGGSALLPAPVYGVPLRDKLTITRELSRAGASISELNCVRKQLSLVKGGRLAAACRAGTLVGLIISDVIGDPLDVIASGPTVPDTTTAADALAVLSKYASRIDIPASINWHLASAAHGDPRDFHSELAGRRVSNHIIGHIDLAIAAATTEARRRGYEVQSQGGSNAGVARDVGVTLAEECLTLHHTAAGPVCVLSGGEPTVEVVPTDLPRKGGRNQELVLAAVQRLWDEDIRGVALLSGGTDGEDGPTDAAGALVDEQVIARAKAGGLHPADFLAINNSYPFFAQAGGHLQTGPTHTNVMDLRVAVVR